MRATPSRTPPRRPRPGRGRLTALLAVVLLALGAAFLLGLLPRLHRRARVAEESKQLAIPSVILISPAPSKAAAPLVLSGELRAEVETPIYARSTGYVRHWLVDLGERVEAGQLLAEIETPEMDRELAAARAELRQAEASRELAQVTAKRWVQLLSGRTVSPQEAEEKQADLAAKTAGSEAAAEKVSRLQEMTGFSKIVAPFAGTVTARKLDVGQLVNAVDGHELFRLAQTEKLRVFVRVPQSYARAVTAGQMAELTLPELPGRTFAAKVVRTAGAIDPGSRTLLTELEVDNAKAGLLSGSYAQVRLKESLPEASLTVPSNCLLFRAEGPQVAIVDARRRVELRSVKMGRDLGPTIEVVEGLSPKEKVVLNPPDALVNGIEVRVDEAAH
jgi:RND family efflux transporter MFP subunit